MRTFNENGTTLDYWCNCTGHRPTSFSRLRRSVSCGVCSKPILKKVKVMKRANVLLDRAKKRERDRGTTTVLGFRSSSNG